MISSPGPHPIPLLDSYAPNPPPSIFCCFCLAQGFSPEMSLEEERWKGYIKDYDGGTLMECRMQPRLPFTDLPHIILQQRRVSAPLAAPRTCQR